MSALVVTAVDHTTDSITIPAHGKVTGDGPGALRVVPGGAIPSGYNPVKDYWLIVVDANTVKLATSSANALAGTAVAITDNGSGQLLLELGIPFRRARTYVPKAVSIAGSQVKSDDFNGLFDADKALHALVTNQPQSVWSGAAIAPWVENWRTAGSNAVGGSVNLPTGWTSAGALSSGDLTNPTSTFPHRHITLNVPATGSYTLTPEFAYYVDDNAYCTFEALIRTSSTLITAAANYDIGLQVVDGASNQNYAILSAIGGAGNWRARAIGAATTNTDTGVALAASKTLLFRIEIMGANVAGLAAGTFRARYYINDVLVATNDFAMTGNGTIRPYFKSAPAGLDNGLKIGRVRLAA